MLLRLDARHGAVVLGLCRLIQIEVEDLDGVAGHGVGEGGGGVGDGADVTGMMRVGSVMVLVASVVGALSVVTCGFGVDALCAGRA